MTIENFFEHRNARYMAKADELEAICRKHNHDLNAFKNIGDMTVKEYVEKRLSEHCTANRRKLQRVNNVVKFGRAH